MTNKPAARPACAHFSSGPCAKIPGWTATLLNTESLGRSHRSSLGKARLKRAITLTREVLQVPDTHLIGIVPASDTGAVEMAMWSLLGERPVDMLAWESFGDGWVSDVMKQLKLDRTRASSPRLMASFPISPPSISTMTWSSPGTAPRPACALPMRSGFRLTARG